MSKTVRSTPGLVNKKASLISRPSDLARLKRLEADLGISFDFNVAWDHNHRRVANDARPETGEKLVLSNGRNSSKVGIKSGSDLRQDDKTTRICLANGLGDPGDVIRFFDYGISGTKLSRPELNRLLETIEANWGCDLIVEDVDRLVRDEKTLVFIGGKLMEGGIRLWDASGAVSYLDFIKKGIAATENRKLIEVRGNPTRHENIRNGALSNKPSFGYVKSKVGKLKIGPNARYLKQMYQLRLEGYTYTKIASWLADNGVLSSKGERWLTQRVRNVLANRINIGWVETTFASGEEVKHYYPELQIIEDATFAAVQKTLVSRAAPAKTSHGLKMAKNHGYMLTGKLTCVKCGGAMKISRFEGNHLRVRCQRSEQKLCNSHEGFSYPDVESAVIDQLRRRLSPDFDDEFLAAEKEIFRAKAARDQGDRDRLDEEIGALEENIRDTMRATHRPGRLQAILFELNEELNQKIAERDSTKSELFHGYVGSKLSSLSNELVLLRERRPFLAQNASELRLLTSLNSMVHEVVARRVDKECIQVDFQFDFTALLGREEDKVVVEESVKVSSAIQTFVSERDLVSNAKDKHRLRTDEFAKIMGIPGLRSYLAKLEENTIRSALDTMVLALHLNVGLRSATLGMGFPSYYAMKSVIDDIRESPFLDSILSAVVHARGPLPGKRRVIATRRPSRSLRSWFRKRGHKVLDLELAHLGAPDRDLTDDEWGRVRATMLANRRAVLRGGAYWLLTRESLRTTLNQMFRVLRGDLTVRIVVGQRKVSSFGKSVNTMTHRGDLDLIVDALNPPHPGT